MTVQAAIAESIQTDSVIHLDAADVTETERDTLLAECEDSVETQNGTEYWGEGWRVHVDAE